MAQISVGYTLRGAFKTLFLENSTLKIPQDNRQPWWVEQEEKVAESIDEAITCKRQTQLMRFITRRSASALHTRQWHNMRDTAVVAY